MFKNYLLVALRNLLGQKFYAMINIGGLAVALAAAILILLFVLDELACDDWIPDAGRIFKIETTIPLQGRDTLLMGQVPPAITPAMARYFPDHVESYSRVFQSESTIGANDRFFAETISFVDPGFFDVFALEMVSGNRAAIANSTSDILISESQARKFFGDADPVGQVLTANISRSDIDPETEYRVAGVFRDIPRNSHMPFNTFAYLDPARFEGINEEFGSAWMNAAYIKLFEGVGAGDLERRLTDFYKNVAPPRGDESEAFDYRTSRRFNLINVADVYLYSDKTQQLKPIGDISIVISFAVVAVLILVIATINFVNLATARALRRAKEVSLRKVLGATRRQLVPQFLGEAVLTTLLSLCVAIFAVALALPIFNQFLNKSMTLNLLGDPLQLAFLALTVVAIGILGGLYPAFFLSSYRPAQVMGSSTSANKGSVTLRELLVVLQFSISIALVVATVFVQKQTDLLRGMDLGLELDNTLVMTGISDSNVAPQVDTLRQEMLAISGVSDTALASDELPLTHYNNSDFVIPELGVMENIDTDQVWVDTHFFDFYGVRPLAGRLYSEAFKADTLVRPEDPDLPWTRSAVVNVSFTRAAGLGNPADMIGRTIIASDYGGEGVHLHASVIGVIDDLHLRALEERTAQMVFYTTNAALDVMALKLDTGNLSATLAAIDATWAKILPQVPIKRYFARDRLDAQYDDEERRGQVYSALAAFAIFVACLGLFGLAAYSVEQRTLEIGVRKVHGAHTSNILALIGTQLLKSVVWANLIAWPVVYFIMRDWLDAYAFRIDMSPLVFLACGLLTLVLAWASVGWQVFRVARRSPILALKHE